MKTILYARVSTADQTIDHQKIQAEKAGFIIDDVIADDGVSGVSTRLEERPGGKRLFDILRRGDVLVVRWVDRLGRDYKDVTNTIRHFMAKGILVRTVINNMTFDGATEDPIKQAVRDALIGFMAATAQAQAEATKAAQRAGIDYAKAKDEQSKDAKAPKHFYLGRKPSYSRDQLKAVQDMTSAGNGVSDIAKITKLTRQTIYRLRADPVSAETVLAAWEGRKAA